MKSYEAVCVFDPTVSDEKVNSIIEKFKKKIEGAGAIVEKVDVWGKRRLSFTLQNYKNLKEGNYIVIYFNSDSNLPKELESVFRVTEEIVRYMISCSKPKTVEVPIVEPDEEKTEISPSLIQSAAENAG